MYFFAQSSLRPNAHDIANQQHPDHQLGIDRWTTYFAEKGGAMCECRTDPQSDLSTAVNNRTEHDLPD